MLDRGLEQSCWSLNQKASDTGSSEAPRARPARSRSSRTGVRATLFYVGVRFLEHLKDTFPLRPVELFLSTHSATVNVAQMLSTVGSRPEISVSRDQPHVGIRRPSASLGPGPISEDYCGPGNNKLLGPSDSTPAYAMRSKTPAISSSRSQFER
jgi:hypothetical protein